MKICPINCVPVRHGPLRERTNPSIVKIIAEDVNRVAVPIIHKNKLRAHVLN
jgi:hypothetical protein